MALKILSCDNAPYQDGINLRVTLDAAPAGALSFYGRMESPIVPLDATHLKPHTVDGGAYKVQVRTGTTEPGRVHRIPFYVVAKDNAGPSNVHGDWLCAGLNTGLMHQVDRALQDILDANKGMLDRAMELVLNNSHWPDGGPVFVRKIYRGEVQNEEGAAFPRICHQAYAFTEDYLGGGGQEAGNPYSDLVNVRSKIECYSLYEDDAEWGFVVKELGMGVMNLLNISRRRTIDLECGARAYQCHCTDGQWQTYYDQTYAVWVVGFTIQWSGMVHLGKYRPDLYD